MISEIYHKTFSNSEDELTGNFFGTMQYIPFTRGLQTIFCNFVKSNDDKLLEVFKRIKDEEFDFEFWKKSKFGEIDGFMKVGNVGIGIEVKYFSGLSGDDQLERETSMLNEWCNKEEKVLLFIAKEDSARNIYSNNYNKPCFTNVHLGYISWEDILLGLDDIQCVNSFEKKMVNDLKKYLFEKGFVSFAGFDDSNLMIDKEQYYEFR